VRPRLSSSRGSFIGGEDSSPILDAADTTGHNPTKRHPEAGGVN
jgi:hypothetical protein